MKSKNQHLLLIQFKGLIISMPNANSILYRVSNEKFFSPFNTLDMYCCVQFILSASIRCDKPSSTILLVIVAAIACEYFLQFFNSCSI